MKITYYHPLLDEYSDVTEKCMCKHGLGSRKPTLKTFRADLLESVSIKIMFNEGVGVWVPCLDPSIKKLHGPLIEAIDKVYYKWVERKIK